MVSKAEQRETSAILPLVIADVYQLAGQFKRVAQGLAEPLGQTQARWQVLSAASDGPTTVPRMARRLGVARQNVQRVSDLLIEEGLAEWRANPDHKTSPRIVLTSSGETVLARLKRNADAYYRRIEGQFSATQLAELRRSLQTLNKALQMEDDPPNVTPLKRRSR